MPLLPKGYTASRALTVDRGSINLEQRTIALSIASEYPVRRVSFDGEEFYEVLVCEPDAVDLTRLRNGAPFLLEHWIGDHVGIVEGARVDSDRVVRGDVRFGTSEQAEKTWRDVAVDQIRPNVSCKYEVLAAEVVRSGTLGELPTVRVTRWAPSEVSSVAIAADPTVGVGRSADSNPEQMPELRPLLDPPAPVAPVQETRTMSETANPIDVRVIQEQTRAGELARVREIQAVASRFNVDPATAINDGTSVADFNAQVLTQLETRSKQRPAIVDLPAADRKRYSLGAVVQALLSGDDKAAEHERAVTRAYEQKGVRLRDGRSFYVPYAMFNQRAWSDGVAKSGTGAELVEQAHRDDMYVPHLISDLAVVRAGARLLTGLNGDADIPAGDGAYATAAHVSETADGDLKKPDFATIPLRARTAAAYTPFTRRMRIQAQPALEQICRQGLSDSLSELVERTCFNGAGSSTVPKGIMQTSGVVAADFEGSPLGSYFDYINMWSKLKGAKGTSAKLGYVTNYQVMTQALTTPRTEGDARMIAELLGSGTEAQIDGLRMFATQEFPTNLGSPSTHTGVIFGDWSKLVIATFGEGLEIGVTEAPLALSGGLVVTAFLDYDLAVLQAKSFAVCDNIPTA